MSHMCDVGSLMLLHDVFRELVQVEIDLSEKIWPVPDRNASFRTKIVGEALPALWLQISLLSLTWDSATAKSPAVTFVSMCCVLATNFSFGVTILLVCTIRLVGVWYCSSHILNLSSGCLV
ncbi:unnamed protein product [Durusdinium trenchii]|uniref:Uncharacterized protein n=1 Tax=Durusdinium trenchii TaxID=1381693 RepID=A0ABP0HL87_9DINO